jgi:trans-aconitate 2-methyltransferase
MAWDPKTYLAFADERTRPAGELLARIALDKPARVVDLGCGPGNSTALLKDRWPQADVLGVDSSPQMIETAEKSGIAARWEIADIANWTPDKPFDVVFSNATYQWLGAHEVLLPRLMRFVAPGGVFAFQVPNNMNAPSHVLMREVAAASPYAAKLRNVRAVAVESPARYFDILSPHAPDIWTTEYLHVLEGEDAVFKWVSGTGLRPYLDALFGDERADFIVRYKAALNAAYPRRDDGRTLFPFSRLFAVAQIGP